MDPFLILFLAFLIGTVAGLRSLTAPAVVAWATHLGWLDLQGTRLAFMGSTLSVAIVSVLALMELVADKLPGTPKRTSPPGLIARLVSGALAGTCLALAGHQPAYLGAILGSAGGLVGAFAGYQARMRSVRALKVPDFVIALLEDLVAVGGAFFIVSRF
jgi:uncharacterized membrane protein